MITERLYLRGILCTGWDDGMGMSLFVLQQFVNLNNVIAGSNQTIDCPVNKYSAAGSDNIDDCACGNV
jgi:hypothetical protein